MMSTFPSLTSQHHPWAVVISCTVEVHHLGHFLFTGPLFSVYFGDSWTLSHNNLLDLWNFVYLVDFATCSTPISIISTVYLAHVVILSTSNRMCSNRLNDMYGEGVL